MAEQGAMFEIANASIEGSQLTFTWATTTTAATTHSGYATRGVPRHLNTPLSGNPVDPSDMIALYTVENHGQKTA
jgi:hypothetical protein